jgi:hypothetical protein
MVFIATFNIISVVFRHTYVHDQYIQIKLTKISYIETLSKVRLIHESVFFKVQFRHVS